jgi:hypothetical protein
MSKTLGSFIKKYIRTHGLNNHKFADLMNDRDPDPASNWSHVTVSKYAWYGLKEMYSNKPIGYPDIPFLIALARTTDTSILYFMELIAPEVVFDTDPEILDLIERFKALPKESRDNLRGLMGWQDFEDD